MGTRRKARECALQMLFAADVAKTVVPNVLTNGYWNELGEVIVDEKTQEFANNLVTGTLRNT